MRAKMGAALAYGAAAALAGTAHGLGVRSQILAEALGALSAQSGSASEISSNDGGRPCESEPMGPADVQEILSDFEHNWMPRGIKGVPVVAPEPMRKVNDLECLAITSNPPAGNVRSVFIAPKFSFLDLLKHAVNPDMIFADMYSGTVSPAEMSMYYTSAWEDMYKGAAQRLAGKDAKCGSAKLEEQTTTSGTAVLRRHDSDCWSYTDGFISALTKLAQVASHYSHDDPVALEAAREFLMRFGYYYPESIFFGEQSFAFTYETSNGRERSIPIKSPGAPSGLGCKERKSNRKSVMSLGYSVYFAPTHVPNESAAIELLDSYMWSGRFFGMEHLNEDETLRFINEFRSSVQPPKPCP